MNKYLITIGILLASLFFSGFFQFGPTPAEQAKAHYLANLDAFSQALADYQLAIEGTDKQKTREAHQQSRLAYKRFEHLIAYFDEGVVKTNLNGAPLPVIQQDGRELLILEPEGLQIMDEMVMEDPIDFEALLEKVHTMRALLPGLIQYEKNRHLTDKMIFEATRFQLIRIMSLGISGYDTPGSLMAIPEAIASMQSLEEDILGFERHPKVSAESRQHLAACSQFFQQAIAQMRQARGFAEFDRAAFIRESLNPLYRQLLILQRSLQIDAFNEITRPLQSINYEGENPFSDDFLNPYFFSYLTEAYDNPALFNLGSYLFYEPVLSAGNQLSCASCHQPDIAFTDGRAKSLSNDGKNSLQRNAPSLINAVYSNRFFYDLRADKLETQMQTVFDSEQEFHTDFSAVGEKLQQSPAYQELFSEAFQDIRWYKGIDQFAITTALASYVKEIRSFNSPFDRYMRKEKESIAPSVIRGFNLFMGKAACGTCHFAPLFNGLVPPEFDENETEVLGVPETIEGIRIDPDSGRMANGRPHEYAQHYLYSFKTPTVRNAARTGPFMHNGVYESLEAVIDFYNQGGGAGMGIKLAHQTLSPDPLGLSTAEEKALIDFLHALTDTKLDIPIPSPLPAFPESSRLHQLDRQNPYSR